MVPAPVYTSVQWSAVREVLLPPCRALLCMPALPGRTAPWGEHAHTDRHQSWLCLTSAAMHASDGTSGMSAQRGREGGLEPDRGQMGRGWGGGEGGTSWVHFACAASPPGSVHSTASQNAHFQDSVCSFSCRTQPTSQQMTRLGNFTMLHGGIHVQAWCQKQWHCSRCLCKLSRCTWRMTLPNGHCLMGIA